MVRLRRKSTSRSKVRQRRPGNDLTPKPSFAYKSRQANEEPTQVPAKASRNFGRFLLQRFGLIILLIALVFLAANMLSVSPDTKVISLTGKNGSFLHDAAVYQNATNQLLAESVWNRNKITVNTNHINRELRRKFLELSSASVTLPLFSKGPVVYIQSAEPALILTAQNGSFVVGTNGKALLKAQNVASVNNLKLPVVNDQGQLNIQVNHQAVTADNVEFIRTVVGQLNAAHFIIASITLPSGTSELDVSVQDKPYKIKFNLESGAGNARQQVGTFVATQAKLQSQRVTPTQYIDVRVTGRAYYK